MGVGLARDGNIPKKSCSRFENRLVATLSVFCGAWMFPPLAKAYGSQRRSLRLPKLLGYQGAKPLIS
jgi:hypothetical protein